MFLKKYIYLILSQGLDMATVAAISQQQQQETSQDDVVCTPDFPMEPLFEVINVKKYLITY